MILDRTLAGVTQLTRTYKGTHYSCSVTHQPDDSMLFTLPDGRTFKIPPTAQSFIPGAHASGWWWWNVAGADTSGTSTPRKQREPELPRAKEGTIARNRQRAENAVRQQGIATTQSGRRHSTRVITRMAHQEGAPEGMVRYFCDGCMNGFAHEATTEPRVCPAGHPAREQQFSAA